jgi:hypothetical protein
MLLKVDESENISLNLHEVGVCMVASQAVPSNSLHIAGRNPHFFMGVTSFKNDSPNDVAVHR